MDFEQARNLNWNKLLGNLGVSVFSFMDSVIMNAVCECIPKSIYC